MDLLFTSAGRRGYLLRYFKEALGEEGRIHAANSDALAPAFAEADRTLITPLIHDPAYIDVLVDYCASNRIRGLVPLFDIDLPVLARARERFTAVGTTVVVAPEEVAVLCNDKWRTHAFLQANGFGSPRTWATLHDAQQAIATGEVAFPLIVKPRWGMGSIGLYMAENTGELDVFHARVKREIERTYLRYEAAEDPAHTVLVQERLGGEEFGLDVINDLNGEQVATIVKRKIAMRSGETDAAVTVDDPVLEALGARLGSLLRHRGNLDVDVFRDAGREHVLELNARFGGGYPFSHLAGADLPRAIVHWLRGEQAPPGCFAVRPDVQGFKTIFPIERTW